VGGRCNILARIQRTLHIMNQWKHHTFGQLEVTQYIETNCEVTSEECHEVISASAKTTSIF